jgi:hypothetical protein
VTYGITIGQSKPIAKQLLRQAGALPEEIEPVLFSMIDEKKKFNLKNVKEALEEFRKKRYK